MRASGSIAHRSASLTVAETPICAHWRQAKSRSPWLRLSLISEICIVYPQDAQSIRQDRSVSRRRVLRYRPAGRRGEFTRSRAQRAEIGLVTPSALVNHGKELEVDLVEPAGEVDDEGSPVGPGHRPAHESLGQPPFEQIRRACVQPVLGQPEVCCDCGTGGQEGLRQRFGRAQFAILGYGEEIHVSGRTPDEAEGGQRGTTD